MPTSAFSVTVDDRAGMFFKVTQVLAESAADIKYVDIIHRRAQTEMFFECELPGPVDAVVHKLRALDGVLSAISAPSMSSIYGKRIIIMGGGAQLGQLASAAISQAD